MRDALHKLTSQLDEEGLEIPLLSEATYALNSLTSINGCSPYTAVLARIPTPLLEDDVALSNKIPDVCSGHTCRLCELTVQAMAKGTAQDRMPRALESQTWPSGEEMEYKVGHQVDWYRDPGSKDTSGWRGPGTVVDLPRLEHGRVGVRNSSDQIITCRPFCQFRSQTFCVLVILSHLRGAIFLGTAACTRMRKCTQPGTVFALGRMRTSAGVWVETSLTEQNRQVLHK